jgi:hypothetical protein
VDALGERDVPDVELGVVDQAPGAAGLRVTSIAAR